MAAPALAATIPNLCWLAPRLITMSTISVPSRKTPLNATAKATPSRRRDDDAAPVPADSSAEVAAKMASSSCRGMEPLERRMALRSHESPSTSNSAPTTIRMASMGT